MDRTHKERREKIILSILDELSQELTKTLDDLQHTHSDAEILDMFQSETKSKIYHWLSVMYDEMEIREKNLETAYDAQKEIIKKLRDSQMNIQAVSSGNKATKELVTKKIGDR